MELRTVVPRLFLISKREADRPRLTRTLPELLPPGGVRTFRKSKKARPRFASENSPTRPAA
jgi:hypothetical protein